MKSRGKKYIIIVTIFVVAVLFTTIGSVYATWDYSNVTPMPLENSVSPNLFMWQEVPSGEEGSVIESTGTAVADSLNNANSNLNSSIHSKENWGLTSISSVDNLHGSDLRAELGLDPTANFLLQFDNPNTRVLYTTTVKIGGNSTLGAVEYLIPEGEWIYPVYKTIVTFNSSTGQWEQGVTQRGYAKSGEYVTFLTAAPFFDPATWTRGKLGTSIADAIYVYSGQRVKAVLDRDTDKIYYKLVVAKRNTKTKVTVSTPNTGTITVLDAKGVRLNVSNNGTRSVRFNNSKANMTFYLEVTGAVEITFDIA